MNPIIRKECAVCSSGLSPLYTIENMPIKLCCVDQPDTSTESMSFSICHSCNTIQLDKLIPLDILYSSSHNTVSVGKTWENYFTLFRDKLVKLIQDKCVLEIGDPSGRLATTLYNYKEWFIVEPNKNNHVNFNTNIHFIEGFFDETFVMDSSIDIIVHSHLFEHIYEPNIFLKKCYDLLCDGGEMFFGIPNMQHITNENLSSCVGVFFEHTIFINKTNVVTMLLNNGFYIVDLIDYENHSTLYHVKKGPVPVIKGLSVIRNYKNVFLESVDKARIFIHSCESYLGKEIYLFGASYNTQFLLAFGFSEYNIVGILDNCKEKQGKYFYGYDLQIFDPEVVRNKKCVVIVRNGYYSKEIIEQLLVINPLLIIVS